MADGASAIIGIMAFGLRLTGSTRLSTASKTHQPTQSVDAVQALVVRLIEAQEQVSRKLDNFIRAHERWVAQEAARFGIFQTQMMNSLSAVAQRDPGILMLAASSGAVQPPVNPSALPAVSMLVPDIPVSEGHETSTEGQSHGQTLQLISFAPRISRPLTTKGIKEPLRCEIPCECCCHDTRLTHATPYWGSSWFGNLYLPRSFFHRSFASCNVQTCRRTQKNRQIAKIKFFFPSWFIAVDMNIRLETFPVHFLLADPPTSFEYVANIPLRPANGHRWCEEVVRVRRRVRE
ncbi:hypothetical protein PHLCEN_2v11452 [Hermanssonia centrifuga]|uniref:Uncharacterized protein n=1 Tax=Hermanssonia centrifuga TaxID=98765 RepID=A0A2R6NKC4_9APHY|nr:hypothetical protein PHLCEN_2v11452 [Hermanssonia centrifuga]